MDISGNGTIGSDFRRILLDITGHMNCKEKRVPEEIILFSNTVAKKLKGQTYEDLRTALKEAETETMGILSQKARHRTDARRYMEDVSMALEVGKKVISDLAVAQNHPAKAALPKHPVKKVA
ncbi:MAG TPA: hypothetical protein DCX32_00335 [Candidatus Moranbacteria bacterium]|nr:MAG: hypothetical protein UW87_C0005G0009 [Candidatus Moranbacteria bacterium GW2011_GWC2_45_10]KKT95295.1 MAG: hypothetical protein UW95_C0002G0038 [Parcubacteria group bacterium GW2011_GWC1_45_14]HAV10985.1 hypothetical protein [Candidatus Moranbacteria bacterium]